MNNIDVVRYSYTITYLICAYVSVREGGGSVVVIWLICYLYQLLQFLENVIIIKTKVLFPRTYVTSELFGYPA